MSCSGKVFLILVIVLLHAILCVKGGSPTDEEDRSRAKRDKRKGGSPSPEDEWESQKDDRDFVIFLSKCLIVSWLAILVLIVGFIYKYKQAKNAQQLAEEAERQKRKNEREKKLLTRSLSKTPSRLLISKERQEKRKSTKKEDINIKEEDKTSTTDSTKNIEAVVDTNSNTAGEIDPKATATTEERDWYLKKIGELEKLLKEDKEKRLRLKKRFKDLMKEKEAIDVQIEEEKNRYAELEQNKKEAEEEWESRLEAAFKDKCMEEGKCLELNKRIEEEKAKNAELEKKNVEQAVLLEGERRKYAELNKQFEELNSTLMEMLTSVDKKRQEKRKQVEEDPIDDEEL